MIENNCIGLVFTNMHDSYLGELTEKRTTGSVPFGGRYRLIDFALSNLVNAGISTVGIITKHNYSSLLDHLGTGRNWDLARNRGGLVILPPYGRPGTGMYNGRLEALSVASGYLKTCREEYVVLTDTNIPSNVDIADALRFHKETDAEFTLIYKNMEIKGALDCQYILDVKDGRVISIRPNTANDTRGNVSLEFVIMKREKVLSICEEIKKTKEHGLMRNYLASRVDETKIMAYEYKGYAEIITGKDDYYRANMGLLSEENREELFLSDRPVYTKVRDDFPASYGLESKAQNSIIADGCIIDGTVINSVLSRGVIVNKGAVVKDSILMQGTKVGDNTEISYTVADKNVVFGANKRILGTPENPIFYKKGSIVK